MTHDHRDDGNRASQTAPGGDPQAVPVYLILERDFIVAQDIADALATDGPCRTIQIAQLMDLAPHLDAEPAIAIAFLEATHDQLAGPDLTGALAARVRHVVLTADGIDTTAGMHLPWQVLPRPFTDQMFRRLLAGLQR